jgi:hypothetical protein
MYTQNFVVKNVVYKAAWTAGRQCDYSSNSLNHEYR